MSMRALWAVLFVVAPLAAVAGYGSTYGTLSGGGGGVSEGGAISGAAASRLLWSNASSELDTATPVAVTSSLDLTSGTLDVGGACTLDSTLGVAGQATFTRDPSDATSANATVRINPATSAANELFLVVQDNGVDEFWVDKEGDAQLTGALRVDGNMDSRAINSCGGSATCDSVGTAGAWCGVDPHGFVFSTGGTAAQAPLTVKVPAQSASGDFGGISVLYGENANAWTNVALNGTSTASAVSPTIQTRGVGTAATHLGFGIVGGIESGADASSATQPVINLDARREAGTPTSPSGSAITAKPLFGVSTFATKVFAVNVNGGLGLRHITPTALSGTVNNYAGCTTTPICRIDGGAADRDVTGIVPGYNSAYEASQSELFFVCNIGTTNNLVLKHENAGSSAANRFTFNGATDRNVLPRSCRTLIYDRTSQLWRSATGD